MTRAPSNAGYDINVDALFERYESREAAGIHAPWFHLFPQAPARILDIGAGTGRDAAWFATLGHSVLAVEPTDALGALGGFDLSNGVLNPGQTNQGTIKKSQWL